VKKISILGSTGKIGTQTLEIIRRYPKHFKVVGLACKHKSKLFEKQVAEFRPTITVITERDGEDSLLKVATVAEADMIVVAVVGLVGLKPTLAAIKAKKDVALATKEVLVVGGNLVMNEVKKNNVNLIPIDSEHSAIFQCLQSGKKKEVNKIYLTMGKGDIAKKSKSELKSVTPADVFNRKKWSLGDKIAVDSASCMNKVFEIIEAHYLFGLKPKQIEVVVHPEYICHSLVEFVDGSIIAELGTADMRRYINYALSYPQRIQAPSSAFSDLLGKKLSFEKSPSDKFPCLTIANQALKKGELAIAAMHGADRAAVECFLKGELNFTDIYTIINKTIDNCEALNNLSLKQILKHEDWGYKFANKLIGKEGRK